MTGPLPGAAQLELLRRINLLGPLPARVEQVLNRPAPGRGAAQLTLPWPPCGAPASEGEVLRVAAGVLADLTSRLPPDLPSVRRWPSGRRTSGPPRGGRRFVLEGLPVSVADLRADLAAAGLLEHRQRQPWFGRAAGKPPERVLLVVGPVADALRESWSQRVQHGSGRRWGRFVGACAAQDALPDAADPLRILRQWAARVGPRNVHVVTTDGLHDQVERLLGRRPVAGGDRHRPGDPVRLHPTQLDALRRVNSVLPFLVSGAEQAARRAALVALMGEEPRGRGRLALPARHLGWTEASGVRLAEGLARSGCTVHGDLAELHRSDFGVGGTVRARDVLEEMVRMIHRVDAAMVSGQGGSR